MLVFLSGTSERSQTFGTFPGNYVAPVWEPQIPISKFLIFASTVTVTTDLTTNGCNIQSVLSLYTKDPPHTHRNIDTSFRLSSHPTVHPQCRYACALLLTVLPWCLLQMLNTDEFVTVCPPHFENKCVGFVMTLLTAWCFEDPFVWKAPETTFTQLLWVFDEISNFKVFEMFILVFLSDL